MPFRPPRPIQQQLFAMLRSSPRVEYKASAYGEHLRACEMGDPSQVSRMEGRNTRRSERHLHFDELVELLVHLGPDAGVLLEWLCSQFRHTAVPLPDASEATRLQHMALQLESDTGRFTQAVLDATDPDGDGGEDITDGEAAGLDRALTETIRRATSARQALRGRIALRVAK